MKDLIVLVADKNMEHTVRGLLQRPQALGMRAVDAEIFVHPRHDPGCVNEAHDFLRPFARSHRHALVVFDHDGSGREGIAPDTLADEVKHRLEANGWPGRAEVIVLAPELEVWVWSDSPQVAACLGWAERQPSLRDWLAATGQWPVDQAKPADPKRAMEASCARRASPARRRSIWTWPARLACAATTNRRFFASAKLSASGFHPSHKTSHPCHLAPPTWDAPSSPRGHPRMGSRMHE